MPYVIGAVRDSEEFFDKYFSKNWCFKVFLGGSWGIQAGSKRVPTYENLANILKAFMKNLKFKFFEIMFECRCECDHRKIEVRAQSAFKTIFKVRVFVEHTLEYIQSQPKI